jgi:hypothetical protein
LALGGITAIAPDRPSRRGSRRCQKPYRREEHRSRDVSEAEQHLRCRAAAPAAGRTAQDCQGHRPGRRSWSSTHRGSAQLPDFESPLYGAFDVKRFPSRFSDIVHPYVRSKGPSLRPDHERGRTRGWVEVKDGPQGHRRRRRPASLRFAHPRATLGWLMTGQLGGSAVPRRSSRVRALDPTTLYSVRHAAGDASCASDARLPGGWDHSFARLEAHGGLRCTTHLGRQAD